MEPFWRPTTNWAESAEKLPKVVALVTVRRQVLNGQSQILSVFSQDQVASNLPSGEKLIAPTTCLCTGSDSSYSPRQRAHKWRHSKPRRSASPGLGLCLHTNSKACDGFPSPNAAAARFISVS